MKINRREDKKIIIGENVEKREPLYTVPQQCNVNWWECKLVQVLENNVKVPQKIKTRNAI